MNTSYEQPTVAQRSRLFRIIQALERSPAVSYIVHSNHRIIYCNPAWDRFANKNGAPQLTKEQIIGLDIFTVIPNVLKDFYFDVFARAQVQGIWEVSYECSSPDLFRKYRMRVHGLTKTSWLLLTNPLIYEGPHHRMAKLRSDLYVQANGLITMCAHCRCARRVDSPEQWDFVPDYLQLKGQATLILSHGFCPTCHAYFYS